MRIKVQLFFLLVSAFGYAQSDVFQKTALEEPEKHITVDSGSNKYDNSVENSSFIHQAVEIMAEPRQGISKYREELVMKIKKSNIQLAASQNRAMIQFVVEKDGSLTDMKVLRESTEGLGNEVIRLLLMSEKWKPALIQGKFVRSSFVLPITVVNNEKNSNK